ncbi:MAG: hypothetical protein K8R74_10545 [Bacteroidales bacterium]|nr:hypothetical protein [Bacteroidales bacterium]
MQKQSSLDELEGFKIYDTSYDKQRKNRLFLPLNKKWYNLFMTGEKEWEIRGLSGTFNLQTVLKGKIVEMRKGYKNCPAWGVVEDVFTVDSINEIPQCVYNKAIPSSVQNEPDVIEFINSYSNKYDKLIIFKISLLKKS